jgi:hypothetical protein
MSLLQHVHVPLGGSPRGTVPGNFQLGIDVRRDLALSHVLLGSKLYEQNTGKKRVKQANRDDLPAKQDHSEVNPEIYRLHLSIVILRHG